MNAPMTLDWPQATLDRAFLSFDGSTLFFRYWPVPGAEKALVLLHRGHEHSGRLGHLIEELALSGTAIYALDARGHGRSSPDGARTVATHARDLDCFMRHIALADGIEMSGLAIVAHSIGAVVATAWVHDYAPPIRALVLAAPAFDIDLRFPMVPQALGMATTLGARPTVRSRVRPEELTQDLARQQSYAADPLISHGISADLLMDLKQTSDRLIADAHAVTVPTQLLLAGDDRVVRPAASRCLFAALGAEPKQAHSFAGLRHDLLGERDRAPVIGAVRSFLEACFERPAGVPDLTGADSAGYTRDEAEALRRPLALASPRGLYWRMSRLALKAGALMSRGLALGLETGFDSGTTLDYVYRNRAEGAGPLGRLIDRSYLNAIGWQGIRQRKIHIEELIGHALARLEEDGTPGRIVDIAAGHGRYVLDALAAGRHLPQSVLLRDYCRRNVAMGRGLIAEHGLAEIARFEEGDAFDRASLAALAPRPTLVIVSGLYELFPENAPVCASLAGLAEAVPEGGYLLYTNQPWHPQLEQIARTLNSHRAGQAWVMRRRSQLEIDQLVRAAGFQKVTQRIDRWGIFTVSLARRVA